jgi:hypothetical protein
MTAPVGKLQRRSPVAAPSARSMWSWLPAYTAPSVTTAGEVTEAWVVQAQRASPVAAFSVPPVGRGLESGRDYLPSLLKATGRAVVHGAHLTTAPS